MEFGRRGFGFRGLDKDSWCPKAHQIVANSYNLSYTSATNYQGSAATL